MKFSLPKISLYTKIVIGSLIAFSLFYSLTLSSLKKISARFGRPPEYFPNLLIRASQTKDSRDLTFLILGQDPRDDSLEKTEVTDTIIIGKYHPGKSINLISLPRDIFDQNLKAKINQIYPLSKEKGGPDFLKKEFSRITGQNIDKYVLITTQNLSDIISVIGGVDVYLEQGFTDTQYPNPEYIKNPSPKIPIYQTIKFDSGWHHLDGKSVIPFVRSRKGGDTAKEGGTDLGRINRQQLVINALFDKLKNQQTFSNLDTLVNLYNFYSTKLITDFTDQDLANMFVPHLKTITSLSINRLELPICETKECLFYHPNQLVYSQWVFLPGDPTLTTFHQYLETKL
jgi:LCP family protein required for cell wall assembly